MLFVGFLTMMSFCALPMLFCLSIMDSLFSLIADNAGLFLGLGMAALLLILI